MTDFAAALAYYDFLQRAMGMTKCERCSSVGWSVFHNSPRERCPKEREERNG